MAPLPHRNGIIGFNTTAALAFGLHGLLRFLPPEIWFWLQWLDLLTPGLVASLWLWLLWRHKKGRGILVLNGVLMALLFAGFNSNLGFQPESTNADLRILTFNAGGFSNSEADLSAANEAIRNLNPDVVVFQEFGFLPWWKKADTLVGVVASQLNLPYSSLYRHRFNVFGLAIFSRYPILQADTLFLPVNVGNAAIKPTLQHPDKTIDLLHLHLASFNYGHRLDTVKGTWNRIQSFPQITRETYREQKQQLKQIFETAEESTSPLMLAGDFNNVPGSWIYRQLDLKYQEAFQEAGSGLGYTHTSWLVPLRIDHVWSDENWEPVFARTVALPGSDHKALLADFRWR